MIYSTAKILRSLQIVLLLFPFANAGASDFAQISGEGNTIYFDIDPSLEYGAADLRVSPPNGSVSIQQFDYGFVPTYSFDNTGLSDGQYNYELSLYPRVAARAKTAAKSSDSEKSDENGRSAAHVKTYANSAVAESPVQSGNFRIENGAMIPPNMDE